MQQLWKRRQRHSNLLGQIIDVNDGGWITKGIFSNSCELLNYTIYSYINLLKFFVLFLI